MYNYGEIRHWPPWIDNMTRLNHVLLALNSSINIVIYTAKVRQNSFILFLAPTGAQEVTIFVRPTIRSKLV